MPHGGRREGSGAKKGQHRIAIDKLKAALEAGLGFPYEEMLAQANLKLFNDFKNDHNVKEFIMFNENMNKRLLANPDQEEMTQAMKSLTAEELAARKVQLLSAIATVVNSNNSDSQTEVETQTETKNH